MTLPTSGEPDDEASRRIRLDAAREVERLVAANAASNATMTRLVDRVREESARRERKIELLEKESRQMRKLLIMVGFAIALLLAIAAFNASNIHQARKNAANTAAAARDAASTNKLLLGCFDVNSECSKLNAQKQKEILDEIKLYELTALYCVRTQPREEDPEGKKFLDCVKRLYPTGPELKGR